MNILVFPFAFVDDFIDILKYHPLAVSFAVRLHLNHIHRRTFEIREGIFFLTFSNLPNKFVSCQIEHFDDVLLHSINRNLQSSILIP